MVDRARQDRADGRTAKQRRFVDEYLVDLNATQAALRAGYSANTSKEQGCRLLTKVHVQAALAERQNARSERTEITADLVIRGLLKEAMRDEEGSSHSARVAAWGHLGKHLGMFKERLEHSGPNEGPIKTMAVTDMDLAKALVGVFHRMSEREATDALGGPLDGKPITPFGEAWRLAPIVRDACRDSSMSGQRRAVTRNQASHSFRASPVAASTAARSSAASSDSAFTSSSALMCSK